MNGMPLLGLDHVATPADHRRPLLALGVLAVAMAGLGTLRLADLRAQATALRADGARITGHQAQPKPGHPVPGRIQAVPPVRWDHLFQALETAANADVSLLAFEPSPQQRSVRLDGEARDLAALLDYLRRIDSAGPFVRVRLQSHQALRDDPQHPVRFTVIAEWGGDA
jgi:hypothetical protein